LDHHFLAGLAFSIENAFVMFHRHGCESAHPGISTENRWSFLKMRWWRAAGLLMKKDQVYGLSVIEQTENLMNAPRRSERFVCE